MKRHAPPEHSASQLTMELERARRLTRSLEMAMRYGAGEKVEDIAADYKCVRHTVMYHARAFGLAKRSRHFPEKVRAAVLADLKRKNPRPIAEIAAKHKVSPAYCSTLAAKHNLRRYSTDHGKRSKAGHRAYKHKGGHQ